MKQEIDRVKNDLETIQKAMGLAPSFGREWIQWIQWMKRDTWLSLWWCLPGFILIASAFVPSENIQRHLGLTWLQWVAILVAAVILALAIAVNKKMTGGDGRPDGLVREYKRINAGGWMTLAPFCLYFVWGKEYHVAGQAFMAGLWLLSSLIIFAGAIHTRYWGFLGWAITLLAFGLCQPWFCLLYTSDAADDLLCV